MFARDSKNLFNPNYFLCFCLKKFNEVSMEDSLFRTVWECWWSTLHSRCLIKRDVGSFRHFMAVSSPSLSPALISFPSLFFASSSPWNPLTRTFSCRSSFLGSYYRLRWNWAVNRKYVAWGWSSNQGPVILMSGSNLGIIEALFQVLF